MSGRASRDKGARFELETCKTFQRMGWPAAERTSDGRRQFGRGDIKNGPPGFYFECDRREKINVPAKFDQIDRDAPPFLTPVLVHRPSRHEAMCTLQLTELLALIKRAEK